ncbi:hypothetical protein ACFQHO_02380 [Actinomadura yumaensis]|uniref:hypothetical protein n=1 Tax=Actinomadura TaxID=1988 RepID=UPI00132694A3|nr:hypothetical protein [Actinomadura sp. J1-007]MWK38256.1 hypothetical protein [Actinomadura sp. J1-007]
MSVLPTGWRELYDLFTDDRNGLYESGHFLAGFECVGSLEWQIELWRLPGYRLLIDRPYLVVGTAFAVWWFTRRRAAGWAGALVLGTVTLADPALLGYDVLRWGPQCARFWRPLSGDSVLWQVIAVMPAVLMVAAVYRPGLRALRVAVCVVVLGSVFTVGADQGHRGQLVKSEKDCRSRVPGEPFPDVSRLSWRERKKAFICAAQQWGGVMAQRRIRPEADLLRDGWDTCRGKIVSVVVQGVEYLCPQVMAERKAAAARRQAEMDAIYERQRVRDEAHCKRGAPRDDAAVRRATRVMSTDESGTYYVGDGAIEDDASFKAALDEGLVAAAGNSVALLPGSDGTQFCLTVMAYRKAPPVSLKGWDRVTEVGFDSPRGKARVGALAEGDETGLPVLTVAGKGPYRLRVHVRGRDESPLQVEGPPVERHLLIVFPGKSKRPKTYKNREH